MLVTVATKSALDLPALNATKGVAWCSDIFLFNSSRSMATQIVRVRHAGVVTSLEIIVIDETNHGGEEVFRQLAEKLDINMADIGKLKVVHK